MLQHTRRTNLSAASSHSAAFILTYLLTILLEGVRTSHGGCAVALDFGAIQCPPGTWCHSALQNPLCGLIPAALSSQQPRLPRERSPRALCSISFFFFPYSFATSSFLLQLFPPARSRAGLNWAGLRWPPAPPAESQPAQLPAAPTCLNLCPTRASTEGLSLPLLLICRVLVGHKNEQKA